MFARRREDEHGPPISSAATRAKICAGARGSSPHWERAPWGVGVGSYTQWEEAGSFA